MQCLAKKRPADSVSRSNQSTRQTGALWRKERISSTCMYRGAQPSVAMGWQEQSAASDALPNPTFVPPSTSLCVGGTSSDLPKTKFQSHPSDDLYNSYLHELGKLGMSTFNLRLKLERKLASEKILFCHLVAPRARRWTDADWRLTTQQSLSLAVPTIIRIS